MNDKKNTKGFSLTEVLISIGILGMGILLVAGTFPVALHFSTIATERTIASAIAEEAFSKIQLYGLGATALRASEDDPNIAGIQLHALISDYDVHAHKAVAAGVQTHDEIRNHVTLLPSLPENIYRFQAELTYPSHDLIVPQNFYNNSMTNPTEDTHILENQEYCWSAILRLLEREAGTVPDPAVDRLVQVTVFVCRRGGRNIRYFESQWHGEMTSEVSIWPQPVKIPMRRLTGGLDSEIEFVNSINHKNLINDGYLIVDDNSGQMYRVMERYPTRDDRDLEWPSGVIQRNFWVIPPPVTGGANPCIGVFQRLIRF
ncbi:MAG: type IV pilus modification PilV family protein [Planctomycetota bacterium]|jgi:prepilin-type N-terminal cleavage/methylation domain-containing protein